MKSNFIVRKAVKPRAKTKPQPKTKPQEKAKPAIAPGWAPQPHRSGRQFRHVRRDFA